MGAFRDLFRVRPPVEEKAFADFDDGFQNKVFGDDWSTTFSASLVQTLGQAPSEAYGRIYRSQSSVYTVVEFLASQVAAVGLKTYRRVNDTDREKLNDHPVANLLAEPAPGLTYSRFMHQLIADLCVFGNAYWLKLEQGNQRKLIPLPPQQVTPRGGNVVAASAYEFRSGQDITRYDAEEVVHFRRYNPDDARVGVSPLEPLRIVLRSDAAALLHWLNVWKNGARVGGWIEMPADMEPMSKEAAERFREGLRAGYSGSSNAGKVGLLEGGAKFSEAAWDAKESQFIEGRKLTLETVARALNVPLAVLSLTESATYASQDAFHSQLYVDTLGPWFKIIEEEFESSVIPWVTNESDIYVEFNFEEKLRGSFDQQTVAYRAAVGVPTMSVNEARALQGLPRIDDPQFDLPVMPANVAYGGAAQPGEAPAPDQRQTPDLRAVPDA